MTNNGAMENRGNHVREAIKNEAVASSIETSTERHRRGRRLFFKLAFRPDVRNRALRLALIVGPVIGLINHGGNIIDGAMDSSHWLKFGLTFIVPYSVSTWSSVMALYDRDAGA